jgi:phosphoribosylformimino-5-aminoimidazole carboxamide ribotide isomerase
LRGGKCVRLRQGDFARETIFGDDPAAMARQWVSQGATRLHLVDLDGAKSGQPANEKAIAAIVGAAKVPCQLGGGLRTEAALRSAFALGVERAVVGTQALKAPEWFQRMAELFPGRLLLGLDAREGRVATAGWLDVGEVDALDLGRRCAALPLAGVIYTDIGRDGMLTGPNLEATAALAAAVPLPIIASGGVGQLADLQALANLRLAGCIVGRALYEGKFTLDQALAVCSRSQERC